MGDSTPALDPVVRWPGRRGGSAVKSVQSRYSAVEAVGVSGGQRLGAVPTLLRSRISVSDKRPATGVPL